MCGIVGYFGLSQVHNDKTAMLQAMCDSIAYRGPNDQGLYVETSVGLGMRRLSIIDVSSGGHQPMATEDGNLRLVFNGEIYNFAPLRAELQKAGHHFISASDTEVILRQYQEEGPRCVQRFNGMFSFAVWDKRTQALFIARDRLGIKPLYYYWDGSQFLFASEIKALLASGLVPKVLDPSAVWDYLTLRYVPQPKTIWKNIFKLLPGHTLTLSAQNSSPVIERFWDIRYDASAPEQTLERYTQEFTDLFLDAVRSHLVADVPVGILLSGGLDSSAVAAAIKEVHRARLDSFSVGFENSPQANELPYAKQVAEWVGTNHHEVVIGLKEFQEFLPQYVFYMDEPMADLASIPLYYVSKLAGERVKVVMSGEGSDETLGGYDFDRVARRWDFIQTFQKLPAWLRRASVSGAALWDPNAANRLRRADYPIAEDLAANPLVMTNLFDSAEKKNLFRAPVTARDSLDEARDLMRGLSIPEPLHRVLYLYCQSWLVDDLLAKADRMTMANSIELRVPFLDHRLVEWLSRTPAWIKVRRDAQGRYVTKRVLREFARPRLPPEILARSKQGFPVPAYEWLKGPLAAWARELIASPAARLNTLFVPSELKRLAVLGTHPQSSLRDQQRLWQLLILELWMQVWLN